MATQQEVMKSFVSSLDKTTLRGKSAVDEAIKACSNFQGMDDLINHFLADRNNSANGDEFLKNYCGIILDNEDTGAITGSDAGGAVTKTAESIIPEDSPSVSVYPTGNSFTYKGLTVNFPDASTLNETQKNIIAGMNTWWIKGGLDLIYETYGISFEDSDATFKTIDVDFNYSEYPDLNSWFNYTYSGGNTTGMTWHLNDKKFLELENTDCNGLMDFSSNDGKYFDTSIASGLITVLKMAKINYEFDLPSTIGKGIACLITGGDYALKTNILNLSNDSQSITQYLKSNSRLDTDVRTTTDKNDSAIGYMLLRYLAKNAENDLTDDSNKGSGGSDNNSTDDGNKKESTVTEYPTSESRTFYLESGYNQGDHFKYEGGLFVTNFNFDKNSVSFDVYNTKDANGIVEYYDENGKFLGADHIEPHSAVINSFSSWWEKAKNLFSSIKDYGFGDVPITHPSVSTLTSITDVPTGTRKILVTNNQAESIYAFAYNIVESVFNGMEIAKNLKNLLTSYEAFDKNDAAEAVIDKTKGKIVEQLIQKFQEAAISLDSEGELAATKIKYETGMDLLKSLEEGGIKELVLQDFDLQKAFENALASVVENAGNIVVDQAMGIATTICGKLLDGNPAIFGLNAMKLIGNSLDGLSKYLTQKFLKDSKPMIFQLGVSQSSESSNLSPVNDSYRYEGGNKNLNNYVLGEKIELRSDFTGIGFNDSDFMINSSSGSLTIQNARDKIMDVAVEGNTIAYAYLSSSEGNLDGSGFSQYEVIIGGNNSANQITAGSGGSSLWGGSGGNDILTGGAGQDNFFFGKGDGADIINNAGSSDVVNLYDVSLADITAATASGNKISVTFNTGSKLQINSTENLSSTFNLADGSFKFNHDSGQWQSA